MGSLFAPYRASQCVSCMRPWASGLHDVFNAVLRQQIRGKKKLSKAHTIKVRLLRDIPRYGRQGTIIPVARGRMRNDLFPQQKAEYLTTAQLREMGMLHVKAERDWSFGTGKTTTAEESSEVPQSVVVDLLDPTRSMELLQTLLPDSLNFYRAPISTPTTQSPKRSPSLPATSAISTEAQHSQGPQVPQKTSIHGSVTVSDISANLRAILAEDEEGSRIVLSPEDISFVEEAEDETDRVKHLGTFEIEIKVKGAPHGIRRRIKVESL